MSETKPELCDACNNSGWLRDGACECREPWLLARRLEEAEIPVTFEASTLEAFDTSVSTSAASAHAICRGIAERGPTDTGLLLTGPAGVGKTALAVGTLRLMIENGAAGLFVAVPKLHRRLQKSFAKGARESESEVMDQLIDAPVLVLDELGARRYTSYSNDVLQEILGERYNDRRATLVTTNYNASELGPRIGDRLMSRLRERSTLIEITDTPDYRLRLQGAAPTDQRPPRIHPRDQIRFDA